MFEYHRIHAGNHKYHVTSDALRVLDAATPEAVNPSDLIKMSARLDSRDYGEACPPAEQAENRASQEQDYGHVTGFYRYRRTPHTLILARQLPSPDAHVLTTAEYAQVLAKPERHAR